MLINMHESANFHYICPFSLYLPMLGIIYFFNEHWKKLCASRPLNYTLLYVSRNFGKDIPGDGYSWD